MDALFVQRVLVEYSRIATHLEELEASERAEEERLRGPYEAGSATERQEFVRRHQLVLGRIEGLVEAQLAILERRQAFARTHRPGSADWERTRLGRPTGAGLRSDAGRTADQGVGQVAAVVDVAHDQDRTPGH